MSEVKAVRGCDKCEGRSVEAAYVAYGDVILCNAKEHTHATTKRDK